MINSLTNVYNIMLHEEKEISVVPLEYLPRGLRKQLICKTAFVRIFFKTKNT